MTSITAKAGRNFLLKVSDGVSPTSFVTVGGVRATSMQINNNPVDITNVASAGFREYLPDGGIQSFSASLDGIKDSLTQGANLLQTAALNRTLITCQIVSDHGDDFVFDAVVMNYGRSGSFDGAEAFSCQLESHGQVAYHE